MGRYFAMPLRRLFCCGLVTAAYSLSALGSAHAAAPDAPLFLPDPLVSRWSLPATRAISGQMHLQSPVTLDDGNGEFAADPGPPPLASPSQATTAVHSVEDDREDQPVSDSEEPRQRMPRDIKRLEIAYHVLNAADLVTTLVCLDRSYCEERNPLYGRNPNPAVIITAKALTSAVHYWAMRRLVKEDPGMARVFGYITVVFQGGVVGYNMTQVF